MNQPCNSLSKKKNELTRTEINVLYLSAHVEAAWHPPAGERRCAFLLPGCVHMNHCKVLRDLLHVLVVEQGVEARLVWKSANKRTNSCESSDVQWLNVSGWCSGRNTTALLHSKDTVHRFVYFQLTHGWGRCRDRWGWRVCCPWGRLSLSHGERHEESQYHAPAGTEKSKQLKYRSEDHLNTCAGLRLHHVQLQYYFITTYTSVFVAKAWCSFIIIIIIIQKQKQAAQIKDPGLGWHIPSSL